MAKTTTEARTRNHASICPSDRTSAILAAGCDFAQWMLDMIEGDDDDIYLDVFRFSFVLDFT